MRYSSDTYPFIYAAIGLNPSSIKYRGIPGYYAITADGFTQDIYGNCDKIMLIHFVRWLRYILSLTTSTLAPPSSVG